MSAKKAGILAALSAAALMVTACGDQSQPTYSAPPKRVLARTPSDEHLKLALRILEYTDGKTHISPRLEELIQQDDVHRSVATDPDYITAWSKFNNAPIFEKERAEHEFARLAEEVTEKWIAFHSKAYNQTLKEIKQGSQLIIEAEDILPLSLSYNWPNRQFTLKNVYTPDIYSFYYFEDEEAPSRPIYNRDGEHIGHIDRRDEAFILPSPEAAKALYNLTIKDTPRDCKSLTRIKSIGPFTTRQYTLDIKYDTTVSDFFSRVTTLIPYHSKLAAPYSETKIHWSGQTYKYYARPLMAFRVRSIEITDCKGIPFGRIEKNKFIPMRPELKDLGLQ
jgi:hypothetical protein